MKKRIANLLSRWADKLCPDTMGARVAALEWRVKADAADSVERIRLLHSMHKVLDEEVRALGRKLTEMERKAEAQRYQPAKGIKRFLCPANAPFIARQAAKTGVSFEEYADRARGVAERMQQAGWTYSSYSDFASSLTRRANTSITRQKRAADSNG